MKLSDVFPIFISLVSVDPCQATNPLEWIATAILNLFVGEETLKAACDDLVDFLGVTENVEPFCDCSAKADLWLGILPVGVKADAFCDSRNKGFQGLACFRLGEFIPTNVQFCCECIAIRSAYFSPVSQQHILSSFPSALDSTETVSH